MEKCDIKLSLYFQCRFLPFTSGISIQGDKGFWTKTALLGNLGQRAVLGFFELYWASLFNSLYATGEYLLETSKNARGLA